MTQGREWVRWKSTHGPKRDWTMWHLMQAQRSDMTTCSVIVERIDAVTHEKPAERVCESCVKAGSRA